MRRGLRAAGGLCACALLALALAGPAAAQAARGEEARGRAARALEAAPASFRAWLETLPESRRRPLLRRLTDMPAHRRERMYRRWDALEEGERRALQELLEERAAAVEGWDPPPWRAERRRRLEELSPESREKLAPLVRRWRAMEPGERRRMRERLERFRMLSPEEQEALIERRFAERSPEERARILDSLREAAHALPPRPLHGPPDEPGEPPPE